MENAIDLDPATWHVLELIASHDRRAVSELIRDAVHRDIHMRTSGDRLGSGWVRDAMSDSPPDFGMPRSNAAA